MLRPAPVGHYLRTAAALGFGERAVLDGTDISPAALTQPEYLVDLDQYRHLFENMARLRGGLGLDIGFSMGVDDMGPLVPAAFSNTTARKCLEDYWPHYGELFGLLSRPVFAASSGNNATIEILAPALTESAYRLCVEEALSMFVKIGGLVVGSKPVFKRIELAFAAPDYRERYRAAFQCDLEFRARRTRVVIDRAWLERPIRTQDEKLTRHFRQNLRDYKQYVKDQTPMTSRVRDVLLRRDAVTLPSLADVARELGLSERTVARHLQDAGTPYRKLVDEFRLAQANALLESGLLSTKEVAYQLGFRDVNAFRRAFKGWTGKTFCDYRDARES